LPDAGRPARLPEVVGVPGLPFRELHHGIACRIYFKPISCGLLAACYPTISALPVGSFITENLMSTPNPEESARKILSIFAEKNVSVGEILMAGQVNLGFLNDRKFRAEDYTVGANYAQQHGWLEFKGTTVKLLKTGA
jgi:hypothetical protein